MLGWSSFFSNCTSVANISLSRTSSFDIVFTALRYPSLNQLYLWFDAKLERPLRIPQNQVPGYTRSHLECSLFWNSEWTTPSLSSLPSSPFFKSYQISKINIRMLPYILLKCNHLQTLRKKCKTSMMKSMISSMPPSSIYKLSKFNYYPSMNPKWLWVK